MVGSFLEVRQEITRVHVNASVSKPTHQWPRVKRNRDLGAAIVGGTHFEPKPRCRCEPLMRSLYLLQASP